MLREYYGKGIYVFYSDLFVCLFVCDIINLEKKIFFFDLMWFMNFIYCFWIKGV